MAEEAQKEQRWIDGNQQDLFAGERDQREEDEDPVVAEEDEAGMVPEEEETPKE